MQIIGFWLICNALLVPLRTWLKAELGDDCISKHMVAVSTNLKLVKVGHTV